MELIKFIFSSFWVWVGMLIFLFMFTNFIQGVTKPMFQAWVLRKKYSNQKEDGRNK